MMQPGSAAKLKVVHDGSQRELTIKLHELPTEQAEMNDEAGDQPQASAGIEVANLTPEIAQQLHLAPTTTGVVVKHVDPSSPLADSGLREGDVIQEVNHQSVKNVSDFHNAMHKDATNPLLLVNRGGRTLFVTA
jgi:serine protease Do